MRSMYGLRHLAIWLAASVLPAQVVAKAVDRAALDVAVREFGALVEQKDLLGAVLMVTQGTDVLAHVALGSRDTAGKLPMQKGTLFRMASNTKAVTAAAVLSLVDAGKISLDDPITRWFPTFASSPSGKKVTVRHLLTHSSGLRIGTLFVSPLMKKSAEHPDAPSLVLECARFGEIGPKEDPGRTYSYNNPGYNLLAGLVEVVSGMGFEDYCREHFYLPLGMSDTCNHETRADLGRMSVVARRKGGRWVAGWSPGDPPTVPFVRGSGGLISTSEDFTKFCRMILDRGTVGDRRLLSEASVLAATQDQIPHIKENRYGFGWRISGKDVFSHGGSDGTWAWCDPTRNIVGCVFTQTQGSKRLSAARQQFQKAVSAAVPRILPTSK